MSQPNQYESMIRRHEEKMQFPIKDFKQKPVFIIVFTSQPYIRIIYNTNRARDFPNL